MYLKYGLNTIYFSLYSTSLSYLDLFSVSVSEMVKVNADLYEKTYQISRERFRVPIAHTAIPPITRIKAIAEYKRRKLLKAAESTTANVAATSNVSVKSILKIPSQSLPGENTSQSSSETIDSTASNDVTLKADTKVNESDSSVIELSGNESVASATVFNTDFAKRDDSLFKISASSCLPSNSTKLNIPRENILVELESLHQSSQAIKKEMLALASIRMNLIWLLRKTTLHETARNHAHT